MVETLKHINWEDFHFLRTNYVLYMISGLLLIILGFVFYKESTSWVNAIAKHLRPYVIQKGTRWKSMLIRTSVVIMFIIGIVSFLGPTWSRIKAPTKKVKSQFVIALDMSESMLVDDISPNRLERAKFKIHDLLKANPRAETNLIVFAASSHVVTPFTTDYKIILDQIDGLQPRMMPVKGTGFNALFDKIEALSLDPVAQSKILLVTDDLEALSIERINNFLQENNVKLFIYPFATPTGGTIPKHNTKSALNTTKLSAFTAIENVFFLEATLDDSDVKDLAKSVSKELIFEDKIDKEDESWKDQGYWFLIPLMILFSFSFRKGWSINSLLLLICLSSCNSNDKTPKSISSFKDLWYTSDYQGQQLYNDKDYANAALKFNDPMHKGVAYYKAGDFVSAEAAFKQDTTTNGLYNLGLTYAKLGKLEASKEAFEQVLSKYPNNTKAKDNLKIIAKAVDSLNANKPKTFKEEKDKALAKNKQNDSPEDLSGGGQEATKKDMEKERKEETAETGQRKGKELDELPDDFKSGQGALPKNILMRKIDDDPALFLTKKFRYQVKKKLVQPEKTAHSW
ncbi:VWA domain-containing protein [Tamlana fucoidanivorans]|uniref:VWA domain-containing protein n=1 Tax=Allotamlana fucoidanivorans TaxID=2583814 RepID=A0A5C4SG08_9FLAO|nr:VWA domain-containing protein [Tamlana fucoidanivorans]TNJ42514.1 VWA domain-containing protein [Tamlana fucoidanivorans]